ncbi:MAG: ribosome recycling factor [Clostridiales bacterium]|nr:MAG: ribosome recycling factor [Clostridiales bacterium]
MKNTYPELEEKMKKCIDALAHELSTIRAGRATAAVLDKVMVDYYGSPTPIGQVAAITTPEPRTLMVAPWDPQVLRAAEKAIQQSDIGINPVNDGKALRLNFPPLTEERRRELARSVKKYGEEAKVAVRNIRRDALEKFKAQKKKSEITEDDLKIAEKDVTELVDKYIKEVDKVVEAKEKEILEV